MLHDPEQGFRDWAKKNDPREYPRKHNVHSAERWISAFAGGTLVALGVSRRSLGGGLLAALGGYLLYRGVRGQDPLYRIAGVNTATEAARPQLGVSQHQGVRVEDSIVIARPPEELYDFWRRLENLPRFMTHLKSVKTLPNGTSHWTAQGPVGFSVSWDAEIVGDQPGEVISWRSLPHSALHNAGAVRFEEVQRGTRVHVSLTYRPPAGKFGAAAAKLLGEDPARQIRHDLEQLKEKLESGAMDHLVNEASKESFPASDPPSFSRGTASKKT